MHLFHGPTDHISCHDPVQGKIGDCWLIAAMGTVADKQPRRIKEMFLNNRKADNGIYAIQLYLLGVPRIVVVDDNLPVKEITYKNSDVKTTMT